MITKRKSSLFSCPLRRLLSRLAAASLRLLLLLPLWAVLTATAARGDETTRRVQEELRKRNLYYGDIDGQRSRATVGALRRYQERKGFTATGESDEITLRSLSIEPPLVAAREDENPALAATTTVADGGSSRGGSWPTGTVLKSDRAPRPRAIGSADEEKDLFSTAVTNVSTRNDGNGSSDSAPPSATAESPSISPPPASVSVVRPPEQGGSPPRPPVGTPLSLDDARQFIEDYLRAGETNQLESEIKYYADQVNYFNQGTVGRAWIRRDVQRYYRRWPQRHFELIEPFVIAPGPREDESTVRFAVRFRYNGADRRGQPVKVEGKTDNVFILQGSRPGDLRIVAMREQRLRS